MKKVLKILSLLLIVPVLGIGSLLAGCKKDSATLNDILKEYNSMVNEYQTQGVAETYNTMFTYSGDANKIDDNTYDYIRPSTESNGNVTFRIQFDSVLTSTVDMEENLKNLYDRLKGMYAYLLQYSNSYFLRYQKDFFTSEVEIDGEELYNLLNKLKNLNNYVEEFKISLDNLTSLAKFITPQTQVMASKIKTFNYVYVNLIKANFEFNLAFCDIHNKYILKDELVTCDTAERLVMEASLKYAYGYFLDAITTYQNNNLCDTTNANLTSEIVKLFKDLSMLTNNTWDYVGVEKPSSELEQSNPSEYNRLLGKYNELESKANNLKQVIDRFDIFLNLYKSNASEFDMYTYNQLRTGGADNTLFSSLNEFRSSLNAEQTAKLTVIENFSNYDLVVLLETTNEILVLGENN